jgi:hypothetical protein
LTPQGDTAILGKSSEAKRLTNNSIRMTKNLDGLEIFTLSSSESDSIDWSNIEKVLSSKKDNNIRKGLSAATVRGTLCHSAQKKKAVTKTLETTAEEDGNSSDNEKARSRACKSTTTNKQIKKKAVNQ